MKNFLKSMLYAGLVVAAGACSDDDNSEEALSNEDAAEIVAMSLSENSSGLAVVVEQSATATDEASGGRQATCGVSDSESFAVSNLPGAAVTYSYSYEYDYLLTCGIGDAPQSFSVGVTYNGMFDGSRMSSEHEGTAELTVTELDQEADTYSMAGSYSATGSFTSKVRNNNATTSVLNYTLTDLAVDKSNQKILSGSAAVTLTGTTTGKGQFSFSATIVFEGEGVAKVTINGTEYTVNLVTGEVG